MAFDYDILGSDCLDNQNSQEIKLQIIMLQITRDSALKRTFKNVGLYDVVIDLCFFIF